MWRQGRAFLVEIATSFIQWQLGRCSKRLRGFEQMIELELQIHFRMDRDPGRIVDVTSRSRTANDNQSEADSGYSNSAGLCTPSLLIKFAR